MRCLKRNKRQIWYCLYKRTDTVTDTYGNEVGSHVVYEQPVEMWANISQATGRSVNEQFGNLENYDKVIVTTDMDCPIDENTVLFVDKAVEYVDRDEPEEETPVSENTEETEETSAETGNEETEPSEDPEPTPPPPYTGDPLYDYIVVRVSKSLNGISIAIRKVDVS